ncbi:MAG: hypothetical protein JRN45_00500 [Nitrososphaerota archaeon]|nr:hypothetical protein [Nitrososphaerota archaeon]
MRGRPGAGNEQSGVLAEVLPPFITDRGEQLGPCPGLRTGCGKEVANLNSNMGYVCRLLRESYDEMPGTLPVITEEEVSSE